MTVPWDPVFATILPRRRRPLPIARLLAVSMVLGSLAWTGPAGGEQPTEESASKVTYEDHVKPILRQHCFVCHSQDEKSGGLALDSYGSMLEGGGSGAVVNDEGTPDASRLWQLVSHLEEPTMPPDQEKIPADQLDVIRRWIEGGILENSGSKVRVKKKNALAFVASESGQPAAGGVMPDRLPQATPVVSQRAAAATAIAASPWAPLIAIGGQQQVVLYHAETEHLLGILPFDEGIPQSIRFSRDGAFLLVAGGEHAVQGIVAVYSVKTGERVATIGDELDTAFDGDANENLTRIALGGPRKILKVYDAADGTLLHRLKKHTDWIYTVAYSPDGVLIASGDRSGGLCVWEADTGQLYLDLTDHKGAVRAVAWRDDSNVLASASEDGTVKLWDMHSGKAIKSIAAHGGGVTDVDFDHQARIVTAGKDRRAKLWDAAGNHLQDFPEMPETVLESAITHDGHQVVYGDWTGAHVLVSVEESPTTRPLPANPQSLEQRLAEATEQVESLQSQLPEREQASAAAANVSSEAAEKLAAVNARLSTLREQLQTATETVDHSRRSVEALNAEIPSLTLASRETHDLVIAHRVNSTSTQESQERLAAAEQKLAEQLAQLASKRRERISSEQAAETNQALLPKLSDEVAQLEKSASELGSNLETAKQAEAESLAAVNELKTRIGVAQEVRGRLVESRREGEG